MSDTDSFIDEVTDELRREKLFATMRRYGVWAALVIVLIIGGAGFLEYQKASARAEAQAFGDRVLAAVTDADAGTRAEVLGAITPKDPNAATVIELLTATAELAGDDRTAAIASLDAAAVNPDTLEIYRLIARFKALTLQTDTLPAADRKLGFEALAQPGAPLRLLAQEQLALIAIQEGDTQAAITGYQALLSDAEVTADLQQRALQVIVALGGEPEMGNGPDLTGATGN